MKILIDNGHGENTPGKCSPDRRLKEYAWTREIAQMLSRELTLKGFDTILLTPEKTDIKLSERVRRVNGWCAKLGAKNVLLVSIHVNAAGNGSQWNKSSGFTVFVSKNASEQSKRLAKNFTTEALRQDMVGNRSVPQSKYWTWSWTTDDIYILRHTQCPAVLTENFFMDNMDDVNYLMSPQGKRDVVNLHIAAITQYLDKL